MIQRIQSLWLLLAAVTVFFLLKLPYAGGVLPTGAVTELVAAGNLIMFIVALLMGIIALVDIFLYKKRSNQKSLIWLGFLLAIVFIVMMYYEMSELAADKKTYKMGAIFPILYIVLIVMAYGGIRKDEKLIKSLDRLR